MTTTTKIVITLEIKGDPADAMTAVDHVLDGGELQEKVNHYHEDQDDMRPLQVLSALATFAEAPASHAHEAASPGRQPARPRLATSPEVWAAERALWHAPQETFIVYDLNVRHRVIERRVIALGTATGVEVHPRDVFRGALRNNAVAMILVHNHPSGDPSPSRQDLELTKRLHEVAAIHGITLLDHVIVAAEGYVSFNERGLL